MAEGKIRGKKQDWLNASHFAKCSSGQYITRKWTDRLRKRTGRHQWSIVCSQGAPSNSSGSQYIKETKIYYAICNEMFYKYKLRQLYFFGLIKALRAVMFPRKYAGRAHIHTHTQNLLPPKVWNLSNPPLQLPFNTSKMHYPYAVKWTLCYSFKARRLSSILFSALYIYIYPATQLCDPLASVLPYRLWQILSGCWEADLQSEARAIFTLAQVWLEVFLQHCNA